MAHELPDKNDFPTEKAYIVYLENALRGVQEFEWLDTPGRDLAELEAEVLKQYDARGDDWPLPPVLVNSRSRF